MPTKCVGCMCVALLLSTSVMYHSGFCSFLLFPFLPHPLLSPSSPFLLLIEAAEQREIERRKKEEKATLKKLHKIIEKEKKKKTKKIRHKKK